MWFGAQNRPYNTVATAGFTPASGYGSSGTTAWDQTFTVTNGTNPFGATGPTLMMFDDFRNGVAGQLMTDNSSPVAGTAVWRTLSFPKLYWWGSANRSGGTSCRLLNNENPDSIGAGGGRRMNIPFGSDFTAIYFFYAEHWHGWDGLNDVGGGGGYYKHNWLQHGNFTTGAFNTCLPDFVSQAQVNTYYEGNDIPPLPQWQVGNQAAVHDKFDQNGWNSLECAYVGNAGNPTGAAGFQYMGLFNSPNKQAINATNSSQTLFDSSSGANGTYASFNGLQFVGLMQDVGTHTVDRADVYIAVGANCMNRFFIGDASTIANCTTIMPCTITSWAAGSVTMTLRQGAFSSPAGNYLYWSDVNNTITQAGQFT